VQVRREVHAHGAPPRPSCCARQQQGRGGGAHVRQGRGRDKLQTRGTPAAASIMLTDAITGEGYTQDGAHLRGGARHEKR